MIILLSIMFVNYILIKKFAYRGILLFGILGGLVNSEATVMSLGRHYNEIDEQYKDYIRLGISLANVSMLLRNIFIAAILDPTVSKDLVRILIIPLGIFICIGIIRVMLLLRRERRELEDLATPEIETPFSLKTAAKFVVVFAIVTFISVLLESIFDVYGIYIAGVIGGLANAGAVTLASVTLFAPRKISVVDASISIILANVSAVANKIIYARASNLEKEIIKKIRSDAIVFFTIVVIYLFIITTNLLPIQVLL
ncbi:MAG: DUF4010 domain-containing protein [Candidatus Asgardarchaeia archaeon]